jgi:hypothetical protein
MRPRLLPVVLSVFVGTGGLLPTGAEVDDPETERGIRQAQEGESERALVTLQGVLPRLIEGKAPASEIARVHVYLGVAHLGLNDPKAAKTDFLDALRVEPALTLSSEEYPPRIVRAFEEARRAAATAEAPTATTPTTTPAVEAPAPPATGRTTEPQPASKKGGSKVPLVLLGVGAVGGGVALAAGGGGGGSSSSSSSSTPTTTVTPPATPTGNVNLIASFPAIGSEVRLPSDPNAGTGVPEISFEVTYGADVAEPYFEINLWRGPDLCFSTQTAYSSRLDAGGPQYLAGTSARFRVAYWTARQPSCGDAFTTDRFEFFWGRPSAALFTQDLPVGWKFVR